MLSAHRQLLRLPVRALDGHAGTIEDALIRQRDWSVRAIVIARDTERARVPREMFAPTQKGTIRSLSILLARAELDPGREPVDREILSLRSLLRYRLRLAGEIHRIRDVIVDPRGWHVRRIISASKGWPFPADAKIVPRFVSAVDHDLRLIEVEPERQYASV